MFNIQIGAIAILAILLGMLGWNWMTEHDAALRESAQKYEECVHREYNTTPTRWYAEHGEYPDCDITK